MKRIGFIDGRRIAGWNFPATATPGNGQVVDVTDPSEGATGSVVAQTLKYRPTGDKTGSDYSIGKRIDVYPQGDLFILEGLQIHFHDPIGAGTFERWWAFDIYLDAIGALATVREISAITVGMNYTNPTVLPHSAFLRLYTHGAVPVPAAIRIAGSGVDSLFYFQRSVTPIAVGAVGGAQNRKIRVHIADVPADYFIPLHTA